MSAKALPVILVLGTGLLALLVLTRKAEAPPEPPVVIPPTEVAFPTADDIMAAQTLPELNTFYRLISEQFLTRQISHVEYMALYNTYKARFYELTGGS